MLYSFDITGTITDLFHSGRCGLVLKHEQHFGKGPECKKHEYCADYAEGQNGIEEGREERFPITYYHIAEKQNITD